MSLIVYPVPQRAAVCRQPQPRVLALPAWPAGTNSGPNYGGTVTGTTWASPSNAAGGDDGTYAVWTVP
jgi:hypothetical protein